MQKLFIPVLIQQHGSALQAIIKLTKNIRYVHSYKEIDLDQYPCNCVHSHTFFVIRMMVCQTETC